MQIPKPSEDDKQFLRSLIPKDDRVEVKPMFGNLGAFVNGNMFSGLFGSSVGVRLDEDALAELSAMDGSGPFGPAERPMRGYASLPAAWRNDPQLAATWLVRAFHYVADLPPKRPKAPKDARVPG